MDGILIINKPQGITSHDVVDFVRKRFNMKKVGHAGSLDPLATGVLLILLGRATRLFNSFTKMDKIYEATLTLGSMTDTGDSCGKIIKTFSCGNITESKIKEVLEKFIGKMRQVPPMVSALKYKGKPLYKLARAGIEVPRSPREITIYEIKLLEFFMPNISFEVKCSKGTYVRTLGEDIASALGCGGHISKITRIAIGEFHIEDSVFLDKINESHLRAWQ
ncbi:MAG: tRNA pseudouridine(55) synthase TruB [Candidatus Omnitrophica bacterium CG11_big_fil_rev_8_21_14_0_20_42_13]|uniref:tRNA pseudouridine synthase B n=1 Tax=Candidatus Ghiorseimicrobium undicola TaxID=1974746 RepID=A0A2H0LV19_9BACT|nr:MAG: tRNA pseudouridine(55) synthase TruB [Candidatus Omnitrophica bacterium CG11_big_fil_rev_8_21_14_0_20_42_13]